MMEHQIRNNFLIGRSHPSANVTSESDEFVINFLIGLQIFNIVSLQVSIARRMFRHQITPENIIRSRFALRNTAARCYL